VGSALHITGLVDRPMSFDANALEALRTVSGTESWVAVADIVDRVRPTNAATHCTVVSSLDGYRASIPIPQIRSGGRLSFAPGRDVDPDVAGQLRLTVTDGTTLCWNVKGVAELHFASGRDPDDVPDRPPH
jgi:DMSO/TMAO reductase YedYZ molybdopterin-dependent catalytic subunit